MQQFNPTSQVCACFPILVSSNMSLRAGRLNRTLLFGVSWIHERVSGCDESEMSAESDVDGVLRRGDADCVHWLDG